MFCFAVSNERGKDIALKKAGRVLEGRTYDAMPETPTVPVARAARTQRSLPVMT